jgi:hypothetical protein
LVSDPDLDPSSRLFVAILDNLRLSEATLQRFLDLYERKKVAAVFLTSTRLNLAPTLVAEDSFLKKG